VLHQVGVSFGLSYVAFTSIDVDDDDEEGDDDNNNNNNNNNIKNYKENDRVLFQTLSSEAGA